MEEKVYNFIENGEELVMIPVNANLFILECWELILCLCGVFIMGFLLGMYITTQIEKKINKNIDRINKINEVVNPNQDIVNEMSAIRKTE
mgnify:CR=1 FL=1